MDAKLHRCPKLHASISLAHCEAMRGRTKGGGFDGIARPPQCNGCTEWMQWDETNTVELTPKKEENMLIKGTCEGCGEYKTLQTKTLCHQCNADKKKEEGGSQPKAAGKKPEKNKAEEIRLNFQDDRDLFEALNKRAHGNYRTAPNEVLAILRTSMEVESRPETSSGI